MNLYEIDAQIKNLLDNGFNGVVDEETGEVLEYGIQDIEELQMARKEKLESVALYLKNLAALAEDIKAEEKALSERRKAHEAKAERLRDYLSGSLISMGEKSFETSKCSVSLRRSEAVIVDEDVLDMTWFKSTTTYKPMLSEIKKAIKSGSAIEGARIEERQNVTIK